MVKETPDVAFGDLIRLLGESIADAQYALDATSARLAAEMGATEVSVPALVEETIAADGSVTSRVVGERTVSLLELGLLPTFYQFSQATVEIAMDMKVMETTDETTPTKKKFLLFADTASVRTERKINRELKVASRVSATLVPVPPPTRIEPARRTVTTPPGQ